LTNKKNMENKEQNWWKWVFIGLAVAIFLALPLMGFKAGNSGDEDHWQHPHSKSLYLYYTTFGKDTSFIDNGLELAYSGYAFDAATMFVIKAFNIDNYMTARHVMNALMGALLMLFTGLLAWLIGGWRAGCMALLLIFFSPQILGHSFNNPKDIPFAAFFMGAVYYMAWFIKEFPNPSWKTIIKLGIMIGATIGIRPGGFLLVPYFGLFVMVYYMIVNKPKEYFSKANQEILKNILIKAFIALGVMLAVMFILWPYALKHPGSIIDSFKRASQFDSVLRQLFEGNLIWSDGLPWYYISKLILITTPIAVFIGASIYLFTARKFEKGNFWLFVLVFGFVFPIFWIAYSKANVYGGWRHVLFAYPTLVVMAALGFNSLIALFNKNKYVRIVLLVLPLLLLANPIAFTIKSHPYQYLFFNKFVGGTKGVFGNYELDYYYHSTREASEWIIKHAEKTGLETTDKITVATWHHPSVQYFFRHDTARFQVGFSRWAERGNNDWDYAIFTVTGMSPDMLKSDVFPPANTVHQIKVDGVPICIILKRTDKSDYFGNIQKREGNLDSAIVLLQKSLEIVPSSESTLLNLAEIYLQKNQSEAAIFYMDKLLAFDPKNETANYYKAHTLMFQNRLDEAQRYLQVIVNHNPKNDIAPWMSAQIYAQQGNLVFMGRMIEQALIANAGRQEEAFNLMRQVYQRMGLSQNDATIAFTQIWIRVLDKLGYKKEAEQLRNQR